MNKLTLAFITHNKLDELTKYVNSIVNKIPKKLDVLLIYDNQKVDNTKLNSRVTFLSWKNIGKFKSILRASDEINTKYLKVIDHDDCIDYRNLDKLIYLLPEGDDCFVYHKASKVYESSEQFGKVTVNESELDLLKEDSEDVNWNKIPNAQAIFNVDVLKEMQSMSEVFTKQDYFNDDLLAIACQYRKKKSIKIDVEFYFQHHEFGQTSRISKEKVISQYDLFLNLNTYFNEFEMLKKGSYSDERMIKRANKYQCKKFNEFYPELSKYFKLANRELNNWMRNNKLSLLITIHSDFEAVEYFISLLKKTENKVIFAFDTANVPSKSIKLIEENGYCYFINESNTGKFNLILNSLKKINTKFFKIVDQDDSISLKHLSKFNKMINKINVECIIKHRAFKIVGNGEIQKRTLDSKFIKRQVKNSVDVNYKQQTNCDTIYHTKTIKKLKESKLNITRQDFHNDVLLSNFVVGLGIELIKLDEGFYIQFHEKGQTSKLNIKRSECVKELYHHYELMTDEFKDFNIINMKDGKIQSHINFIKRFTKDYLSEVNQSLGDELYNDTMEILERLWRNEA